MRTTVSSGAVGVGLALMVLLLGVFLTDLDLVPLDFKVLVFLDVFDFGIYNI
jgi:hypothetical protein